MKIGVFFQKDVSHRNKEFICANTTWYKFWTVLPATDLGDNLNYASDGKYSPSGELMQ